MAPCKECKDRFLGCHSKCERYAEMKAENEKTRKNREDYFKKHGYDCKTVSGAYNWR